MTQDDNPGAQNPEFQNPQGDPGPQQAPGQDVPDPQDVQNNKAMAIIAYIIFFIPLLTGDHKKSRFVKFHANQGLVLFLGIVAWWIVWTILSIVSLGILGLIMPLAMLVPIVWMVLGIVNAAHGQLKPLPLIGKITILT